jgi:predicted  nucleic acid-binding Zn-ribbon protein
MLDELKNTMKKKMELEEKITGIKQDTEAKFAAYEEAFESHKKEKTNLD